MVLYLIQIEIDKFSKYLFRTYLSKYTHNSFIYLFLTTF